jgi:hypothetical protein
MILDLPFTLALPIYFGMFSESTWFWLVLAILLWGFIMFFNCRIIPSLSSN